MSSSSPKDEKKNVLDVLSATWRKCSLCTQNIVLLPHDWLQRDVEAAALHTQEQVTMQLERDITRQQTFINDRVIRTVEDFFRTLQDTFCLEARQALDVARLCTQASLAFPLELLMEMVRLHGGEFFVSSPVGTSCRRVCCGSVPNNSIVVEISCVFQLVALEDEDGEPRTVGDCPVEIFVELSSSAATATATAATPTTMTTTMMYFEMCFFTAEDYVGVGMGSAVGGAMGSAVGSAIGGGSDIGSGTGATHACAGASDSGENEEEVAVVSLFASVQDTT